MQRRIFLVCALTFATLAVAAGDLPCSRQSSRRTARRLRLRARRGELLAHLEGDDPDLENEREAGRDQERHADRPAREEGHTDRALDVSQAQLPDHKGPVGLMSTTRLNCTLCA